MTNWFLIRYLYVNQIINLFSGYLQESSLECYHPSNLINTTLPNLPEDLFSPIGHWLDGKLTVCGNQNNCYQLQKFPDRFEWSLNYNPAAYIRQSTTKVLTSKLDWHLYSLDGRDIIIYDRMKQKSQVIKDAFEEYMEDLCAFITNDDTIHAITSENWYQCKRGQKCAKHEIELKFTKPECLKFAEDQVLVLDNDEAFLCHDLECELLEDYAHTKDASSQITELDEIPTVLGGNDVEVELIYLDKNGSIDEIKTAKNFLRNPRKQFAIILVPQSYFAEF